MPRPDRRLLLLACVVLLACLPTRASADPPTPPATPPLTRVAGGRVARTVTADSLAKLTPDPDGLVRVLVELADPPLARQLGPASASPSLKAGTAKVDLDTAAARGAAARLAQAQAKVTADLQAAAPGARVERGYSVVFNGLAVALPPADAPALASLPGVQAVYPNRRFQVTTDASVAYIHAPQAWAALGGADHAGQGIKVAVVDTGIRPETPLFDGAGYAYPADGGPWPKGYCADHAGFCNAKLIAARFYPPPFPLPAAEVSTPLDRHGHGSHTAGTAVGNAGVTASLSTLSRPISGVAPRAWLMVYKALLSVGDGNAVGSTTMLVAALEDAVRDGADVISNSWGFAEPGDPTDFPEAQAAENAIAAGVIVVFAAGNAGSLPATLTPPGNTPGVITVGATTPPRTFAAEAQLSAPGVESLAVRGVSLGQGATGALVSAEGVADQTGDTSGQAVHPYPAGVFAGKVVLVRRGGVARVTKSANVAAGGAVGMILINADTGQSLDADRHSLPTVHVTFEDGERVRAYLTAHPDTTATLTPAEAAPAQADVVADFSSRGPNWDPEVVKPDVVAPGVNILSGYSPDAPLDPGPFSLLSGTSMATPHVAGAAALLRQRYPQWTPAQVKSALMTSAITEGVVAEDGQTPADVNLRGAGRIDVARALDPGLVFDHPSLGLRAVVGRAERTVTATNVSTGAATYTVSGTTAAAGARLSVRPSAFTLAPGEAIRLTVQMDLTGAPLGDYTTGQIHFAEVGGPRQGHLVTWLHAAPSDMPTEVAIEARSDGGENDFGLTPNVDLSALDITTFGLTPPEVRRLTISADPDTDPRTDPLDPARGWSVVPLTLDAGTTWLAARTGQPGPGLGDVDVYLLHDANGDGRFDLETEKVAESRNLTTNDEVRLENPTPGQYALAVHAFRGAGDFELRLWRLGAAQPSVAPLQVVPPGGGLVAGQSYHLGLRWAGVTQPGETYYGLGRLAGPGGPLGPSTVVRIGRLADSEVTKTVSTTQATVGQPITYTLTATNFAAAADDVRLRDALPPGLELVPDSLQGATYDAQTRTLEAATTLRGAREAIEFGAGTAAQSPLGRYVDLPTELGTAPLSQGSDGDDVGVDWDLPEGLPGFPYFGQTYRRLGLVSNGYIVPGGLNGRDDILFRPTRLPDAARPNPALAPFWTDLALNQYRTGHGEWYADVVTGGSLGARHAVVVQWREVAHRTVRDSRFSFEIVLVLETGEVVYVYDTLTGQVDRVTIGAESPDGGQGATWYLDGAPADHAPIRGTALRLDIQPGVERYARHVVRYQARPVAPGVITNTVNLDKGGAVGEASASAAVTAQGYAIFLPWLRR